MPAVEEDSRSPNPNPHPNPNPVDTPRKRRASLTELWFRDQHLNLKNVVFKMHQIQQQSEPPTPRMAAPLGQGDEYDPFSLISDESLSLILSKLPISHHASNSLVCKRWLTVQGRLVRSITLLDWDFLDSGKLTGRFPNLTEVNLVPASFKSVGSSGILLSHKLVTIHLDSVLVNDDALIGEDGVLGSDLIDRGLKVLGAGCANLRKLAVANPSEEGLGFVAQCCVTLQEFEIQCCKDMSLKAISGFNNLQILKLTGSVEGLYDSGVTDIGLTILAQGCRRLVKLELSGSEGSYDGIKAIGQCCQMLEELTLCAHKMDGGWLAALSYCSNLKTLKLRSCDNIDSYPGPDEHLGSCPTLEELYLEHCQMRDKESSKALFLVCKSVREISIQDCWGLEDDIFRYTTICRRVKSLSLEGCSLLTTEGLDSLVHTWKELQTLRVVSCNSIKDADITPELATLFSALKELKWRPDSKSLLASSLADTGLGKKGGRFFKRV